MWSVHHGSTPPRLGSSPRWPSGASVQSHASPFQLRPARSRTGTSLHLCFRQWLSSTVRSSMSSHLTQVIGATAGERRPHSSSRRPAPVSVASSPRAPTTFKPASGREANMAPDWPTSAGPRTTTFGSSLSTAGTCHPQATPRLPSWRRLTSSYHVSPCLCARGGAAVDVSRRNDHCCRQRHAPGGRRALRDHVERRPVPRLEYPHSLP